MNRTALWCIAPLYLMLAIVAFLVWTRASVQDHPEFQTIPRPLRRRAWVPGLTVVLTSCYLAVLLLGWSAACNWDLNQASLAWSRSWNTVSTTVCWGSLAVVGLSFVSPGLLWTSLGEERHRFDEDRKHTIDWHNCDANGCPKLTPLTRDQDYHVQRHRTCALWWLAFWILVPPLWFFLEFSFATKYMPDRVIDYDRLKSIQSLGSQIWIAWIIVYGTWQGIPRQYWPR